MKSSKGRRIIRDLEVCLTNVSPMFGQRLDNRLRPSQMVRFVLAKCKHGTPNILITIRLLAFQRGRALRLGLKSIILPTGYISY